MNTYQHRWLLAQALGTGVDTAGGSSGSYGDPVQETAPAQPIQTAAQEKPRWYGVALGATLGFLGGIALSYWAVESNAREAR